MNLFDGIKIWSNMYLEAEICIEKKEYNKIKLRGICIMKKKYFVMGIMIVFVLVLGYYLFLKPPKYNADDIKTVTLITLPSPPKYKTVDDKKDVKKCVDYINSLELSPTVFTGKGWWFQIKIDEKYTLSFMDKYVLINERAYKIHNSDYDSALRTLYSNLNAKEGDWGK